MWNFPDGIPQHREPLYSPRPDMVAKYPTHDDKKAFWRLPTLYKSVQQDNIQKNVAARAEQIDRKIAHERDVQRGKSRAFLPVQLSCAHGRSLRTWERTPWCERR